MFLNFCGNKNALYLYIYCQTSDLYGKKPHTHTPNATSLDLQ